MNQRGRGNSEVTGRVTIRLYGITEYRKLYLDLMVSNARYRSELTDWTNSESEWGPLLTEAVMAE